MHVTRRPQAAILTRRAWFSHTAGLLGTAALASLVGDVPAVSQAASGIGGRSAGGGLPGLPHFAPRAKRVIYLFQSGGPS